MQVDHQLSNKINAIVQLTIFGLIKYINVVETVQVLQILIQERNQLLKLVHVLTTLIGMISN